MQAYESMQTLLSPVSNYKALREATMQVPGTDPLVPYLGTYLGDLTFIEEGNPDKLNGMINYSKWRMIVSSITYLQARQLVDYQLTAVYDIQRWLAQVDSWNEKVSLWLPLLVWSNVARQKIRSLFVISLFSFITPP